MSWFPGGTKLLISGQGGSGIWGIWTLSTLSGEIRKLQDTTGSAALSPDGSRVVFERQEELWQMGPNGENPASLVAAPPGQPFGGHAGFARFSNLTWSPDGRWLTYLRKAYATSPSSLQYEARPANAVVLEARIPGSDTATTVFEDPDLRSFCWISPTQIVMDRWESPDRPFSNLWQIDVDPQTMRATDSARRLTNWAGFAIGTMSASISSGRLVLTRRLDKSDIYVAGLADRGNKLNRRRRINREDRIEWPGGWSADSQWLLFQSDRTGNMSIFKQRIDSANAELVAASKEDHRGPLFSPDQQWILFFAWPRSAGPVVTGRLIRVPVGGGSPETILEAKHMSDSTQASDLILLPTAARHPGFRCSSAPAGSCVLSEAGANEVVFSSFAPVPSAVRSEIFRISAKNPADLAWDLTPNGSRIAYSEYELRSASIHILDLQSRATREVRLQGWAELTSLAWSADGQSLFVTSFSPTGSSLLRVTLDGRFWVLFKAAKDVELPKPSPDGRSLAFSEIVSASNVWLLEGFLR